MSVVEVLKSIIKYYVSCFLIVWLLLRIPNHTVIQTETFCWLWIALFALFWPSKLVIHKTQLNWNCINLLLLFITILIIPFMQADKLFDPLNFTSFTLSLSLLLGPAVCEELIFRARFEALCKPLTSNFWISILNGLLFTSLHILFKGIGIPQILTFIPGILLWVIYKKSNNLVTVILVHWLLNTAFYALLLNKTLNLQLFFEKFLV